MEHIDFEDFKGFVSGFKEPVYRRIIEYIPDHDKRFSEMMRCYVDRKGQYRRPSYLLLWTLLYGGDVKDAILPAAVQQASEDAVLMHDDILDQNELRRGGKAAHVMYGMDYAIIAGDALYSVMWKMAFDAAVSIGTRGTAYLNKLHDMIFMTDYGQYLDVRLGKEFGIDEFDEDSYYKSIHMKSAYYSVYGPMQCGAIIAGHQENEVMDRISKYGTYAGYAFQIKDDILDCSSTEDVLGKSIGNDVKEGTKTLILMHAVQNAGTNSLARMKEIYSKGPGQKTSEEIKFVLEKFGELGSLTYAEKKAEEFTEKAISEFDKLEHSVSDPKLKSLARESLGHASRRSK